MHSAADHPEASVAIRVNLGAIFVSMELGKSTWLITSLSPGGGEGAVAGVVGIESWRSLRGVKPRIIRR